MTGRASERGVLGEYLRGDPPPPIRLAHSRDHPPTPPAWMLVPLEWRADGGPGDPRLHQAPRHSAGSGGCLDLSVTPRPHPGHRHRRCRTTSVVWEHETSGIATSRKERATVSRGSAFFDDAAEGSIRAPS